jgi:hypothetical protein
MALDIIKQLEKLYPNDQEFGTEVRELLKHANTCCDKFENHVKGTVANRDAVLCKECGKFITFI